MEILEQRLEKLLTEFRYKSSCTWRTELKRLQPHHIAALKADLLPFIEKEIAESYSNGLFNGQIDIIQRF